MKLITLLSLILTTSLFTYASDCIEYSNEDFEEIKRVRLDFTSPLGYTRHLLLGFTPDDAASDDFDYGYDAPNIENWQDDLNWMINDERYVIQGVGSFDNSKIYPLGLFLSNQGNIDIHVTSLENFEEPIDVFLYDALYGQFTEINDASFVQALDSGEYLNRFFITFSNSVSTDSLSVQEFNHKDDLKIFNNSAENVVYVQGKSNSSTILKEVILHSIDGKEIKRFSNLNSSKLQINMIDHQIQPIVITVKTNNYIIRKKLLL